MLQRGKNLGLGFIYFCLYSLGAQFVQEEEAFRVSLFQLDCGYLMYAQEWSAAKEKQSIIQRAMSVLLETDGVLALPTAPGG